MAQRTMVVVGFDQAELLDIACVTTTLAMANALGGRIRTYRIDVASPGGRPIVSPSRLTLQSQHAIERLTGPVDTLVVSGGPGHDRAAETPGLVAHVRRLAGVSRRVASVYTGASVLAAAGILDGRRATTHWRYADDLAGRYPAVTVDPGPIFVRDGNVTTSAGVTSALDLTLALVEEDHGAELARAVARELVTYLQRPGNQAQMSMFTSTPAPSHEVVRQIVDLVVADPGGDQSTAVLAARSGVRGQPASPDAPVHRTPRTNSGEVRTTDPGGSRRQAPGVHHPPVSAIARRCGFGSAETMRQAFVATYGTSPARYRGMQGLPRAG